LASFAGDQARNLVSMAFYFVGGRWSRPMFNARPFAVKLVRHEPHIFAGMKLLSAVPCQARTQMRSLTLAQSGGWLGDRATGPPPAVLGLKCD
jgi:hypothetical protein